MTSLFWSLFGSAPDPRPNSLLEEEFSSHYDAILDHIFKHTRGDAWFKTEDETIQTGVLLRVDTAYRVFPEGESQLVSFETAVNGLGPLVAVKIRSAAVYAAFTTLAENADSVAIDENVEVQVLDTMSQLSQANKKQCVALIRDERCLVCWSDDLDHIIPTCEEIEKDLMKVVWTNRPVSLQPSLVDGEGKKKKRRKRNKKSPKGAQGDAEET